MFSWLKSKFMYNNKKSDDKTLVNKTLSDFIKDVLPLDKEKYNNLISNKGYNGYKFIIDNQGNNPEITHNGALIKLKPSIDGDSPDKIISALNNLASINDSNAQNSDIVQSKPQIECYNASINNNEKFYCPICNSVEDENRIITHTYLCDNNKKDYCQNKKLNAGNKRRRKKTNKKSKKNKNIRRKTFRRH